MHAEHLADHETQIPRSSEMDKVARLFHLVQDDFNPDDPYETRISGVGFQLGSPFFSDGIAFCVLFGEQMDDRTTMIQGSSAYDLAERYHDGLPTQVEWIDSSGTPI